MRIDWTKVGKEFAPDQAARDRILRATSAVDRATEPLPGNFGCWLELTDKPLELGMMQGMGIKGVIKDFKLPGVTHVAIALECAPMGLYGVRCHYEFGHQRVEVWFIDAGDSITPVLAKVYAKDREGVLTE